MQIPNSIIEPCAAVAGAKYVIAFNDDDWDCWNTLDEASTYLGLAPGWPMVLQCARRRHDR